MKPYYQRKGVTLYCGDCHDVFPGLKPKSFSALITDPPYCSGGATSSSRNMDPVNKYCQNGNACGRPSFSGDAKDQRSFAFWSMTWLSCARRLLKPSAYALVFTDWRQLPSTSDAFQGSDLIWRGIIAWDKGLSSRAPHKGYARHQCEYVVWGTNGKCNPRSDVGPFPGCFRESVKQSDKHHITGKPTALMEQLVEFCPAGESIIDCFAGSGTTLVACAKSGRSAVGIEREEANCEIAVRRLKEII